MCLLELGHIFDAIIQRYKFTHYILEREKMGSERKFIGQNDVQYKH